MAERLTQTDFESRAAMAGYARVAVKRRYTETQWLTLPDEAKRAHAWLIEKLKALESDAEQHANLRSIEAVDPHANGCPDWPGICECFPRR